MRKHGNKAAPLMSLRASLCAAMALATPAANALDLSWRPQVRIGTRATDNALWVSQNQESALGFDNGGSLELKAETAEWKSKLNPSLNIRRFAIGEDLDANEYGVRSQHQWLATDRLVFSTNLDYVRDSTLSTELSDVGVRNQVANRDAVTAQPSVTFLLDDKITLTGGYLYSDVSFDTDANGQLVDYSYEQVSASVARAWRDDLRFFISGYASEFETSDFDARTRTYGAQGGLEYAYRPDMGATLSIGYTISDIEFQSQFLAVDPRTPSRLVLATRTEEVSTDSPIASASLYKDFESTRTRLDYNRRVSPSIRGSQQLEDDILFTAEHDLSRELRMGFRGGYNIRSSELQNVDLFTARATTFQLNRDQLSIGGWISYAINQKASVRADYRFAKNSFDEAQQRASIYNNSIFLTFVYNGESRLLRGF